MSKSARSTRGQASSSRKETMEERVRKFELFDNGNHQMNYNNLVGCSIHFGDVVDWEFLSNKGLAQSFFNFINRDTFSGPQWVNLFKINKPIFRVLVRELSASFKFNATPCRYEPLHKGVTFRLGGMEREMSLLEFGWRVGLYFEGESRDVATLYGLRNAETVNATRLTHSFWPSIDDGMFNVGNTKAQSLRNPRIKLSHRCITMSITGRKETTNRVTEIDLFYLYCILGNGLFVTSLIGLPRVVDESKGDDEEGNREGGNEGVVGSVNIYRNISQGDWQVRQARWMDQQDERLGRIDAWMGQQDERAH
uniref:Retrotransposon Orf1 n=1 Tax=Tanacetum cinerariifolium TaxID=118510 RepID=A0A6L2MHA3_TANCI|nr:retrotransposon Orf1 [Tanacetum cinerariifolium]